MGFHAESGEIYAEDGEKEKEERVNSAYYNSIPERVIGACIEVHRKLGPGLLESAYRECLSREFELRGISYAREVAVPVIYKDVHLECGYRIDFLIEGCVVLELKSVEGVAPVHEAQLLTYLSLGGWKVGLLINFNEIVLKNGIRRRVMNFEE